MTSLLLPECAMTAQHFCSACQLALLILHHHLSLLGIPLAVNIPCLTTWLSCWEAHWALADTVRCLWACFSRENLGDLATTPATWESTHSILRKIAWVLCPLLDSSSQLQSKSKNLVKALANMDRSSTTAIKRKAPIVLDSDDEEYVSHTFNVYHVDNLSSDDLNDSPRPPRKSLLRPTSASDQPSHVTAPDEE